MKQVWLSLFGLALAGCAEVAPLATASLDQGLVQQEDCSSYNCGLNSPVIDGVYFSSLHLSPLISNPHGMRVAHFASDENNALAGVYFAPGADVVQGATLQLAVGNVMVLERGSKRYFLRLFSASTTQLLWALPSGVVTSYQLKYTTAEELLRCRAASPTAQPDCSRIYREICKHQDLGDGWSMLGALIFEGNQYDQQSLEVTASAVLPANDTWFNVACEGSLPAKMLLTRRTFATNLGAIPLAEQQAFARMWAGDYCGSGQVFTRANFPLRIRPRTALGSTGSMVPSHPASFDKLASIDAIWDEHGATCMNTPRLDTAVPAIDPDPETPQLETWESTIRGICAEQGHPLPRCTPAVAPAGWLPAGWGAQGYVVSVNPIAAP
jgi:ADYC domain